MNATSERLMVMLLAGLVASCGDGTSTPEAPEDPPAVEVTTWSDRTELFMEYPPLVAGDQVRFAIHLTDLDTFQPIREGRAVVRFEGESIIRFETDAPGTPGIFGVDVLVPPARRYQMVVEVESGGWRDEHRIGAVTVHADADSALAAVDTNEEEGAVSFLKEQQWTLDFATAAIESRPLRAAISVPAEIEPRAGGSAEVRAPAAGRVASGGGRVVGAPVTVGDVLAELVVRNERPGEAPVLALEIAAAEAQLQLADSDLARVERLAAAGAVPQRRLTEATAARSAAATRLQIAQEQLRHLELTRSGEGAGTADERLVIRAPLSGVLASAQVTTGATIEEGQLLFEIVALDRVYIVGAVPERDLATLSAVSEAEIDVAGIDEPLRSTRLVSVGRVVDRASRTVPITFELTGPPRSLALGQAVTLRLLSSSPAPVLAVPSQAVVDDGGQTIVFIQAGGERFERRPVRIGRRLEGNVVEILDGLGEGERVVTRGAHLVRLAALSPRTPGHGHVH